jgi:hypothetical protein
MRGFTPTRHTAYSCIGYLVATEHHANASENKV